MKLFCENCGTLFSEDEIGTYKWTDELGREWEDYECTVCHRGIINQANLCGLCGDYVVLPTAGDYYPRGNYKTGDICPACAEEIDKELIKAINEVRRVHPNIFAEDVAEIVFNRAEYKNWYEEEMREEDNDAARLQKS